MSEAALETDVAVPPAEKKQRPTDVRLQNSRHCRHIETELRKGEAALAGKEADVRSDIFAFGAIMYEMAIGRRAFQGSSNAALIASSE